MRPFALVAWSFLTLGIAAGSFWAYYTLGWGGFWFWDPVENASLMPWLAGTAFIHSVAVMEKRDALKVWTIFLAILAFSFSLLGTFLVRSGVLTSVHAFASDPRRGVFILAILALFIFGSFALFAWRAPMLKQGGLFAPISREGALVLNNLLLTTACATVLFGTLYPLALEQLTGEKITVGAPFFNLTCGVLLLVACFAAPFGFSLAWKRGDLLGVAQRLAVALVGGAVAAVARRGLAQRRSGPGADRGGPRDFRHARHAERGRQARVAAGLGARRGAHARARAAAVVLGRRARPYRRRRDLARPRRRGFGAETIATLHKGVPQRVGPYDHARFDRRARRAELPGGGDADDRALGRRRRRDDRAGAPPIRGPADGDDAGRARDAEFRPDLCLDRRPDADGGVPARLYWKPLVTLIWLGGCAMALGGALSLADRRLRFGVAGARARRGRRAGGVGRWRLHRAVANHRCGWRDPPRPPPKGWESAHRFAASADGPRSRLRWSFSPSSRSPTPALAVQPDEVMPDPALEARARALSAELRCMVCQNQSIDDSDAPLARDIRVLIRERIARGRKQRRGARVPRLALRRLHPVEAAVQARDAAAVAQPAAGPRRRLAAALFARRARRPRRRR